MSYPSFTPQEVTSMMNLIDTYVRWKTYSQSNNRSYEYYHPSEWGNCLRMQQYKHYAWKGLIDVTPMPIDSQKQRLFDKGHNMHSRWSSYFDDIGNVLMGRWKCKNPLCFSCDDDGQYKKLDKKIIEKMLKENRSRIYGSEEPVFKPKKCVCGSCEFDYLETTVFSPELNIKGHADLVLNCDNLLEERFDGVRITYNKDFLPINGKKVVGDMKTIGSNSWNTQLKRKGAHKKYIIQLTIYVHILDCDYGIIMYENKDNSEMLWYQVKKNYKWWEVIQDQARQMIRMSSKRKLPPPKYDSKTNYACKYCEFKDLCHKSKVWDDPKKLEESRKNFYKYLL